MPKVFLCFLVVVVHLADGFFGNFYNFPAFPKLAQCSISSPFPTITPFNSMFNNNFHRFSMPMPSFNFGDIARRIDRTFRPMQTQQAKRQMMDGRGGTTIVSFNNVHLIKRDGSSFFCNGQLIPKEPFCLGPLQRVQIRVLQDYCLSENYQQQGDVLCIANSEQTGLSLSTNNGRSVCVGSDQKPGFLITQTDYRNLCGRLPWEKTYSYYPKRDNFSHVKLPNPDLGCLENKPDVCVFRSNP